MEFKTRFANYGGFIEVEVDETKVDIFKNGNESNEFISNLLQVIEDVCTLREESIFEYLEKHYNIEIDVKEQK